MNTDYSFFNYPIFRISEDINNSVAIEKRTILVLATPDDFDEDNQVLLQNILKAVQIDLTTQAHLLLDTDKNTTHWSAYPVQLMLSFGVPLKNIGLNYTIPPYQLFTYQQQSFLCVDKLSKIAAQKPLKAALWNALKGFSVGG